MKKEPKTKPSKEVQPGEFDKSKPAPKHIEHPPVKHPHGVPAKPEVNPTPHPHNPETPVSGQTQQHQA